MRTANDETWLSWAAMSSPPRQGRNTPYGALWMSWAVARFPALYQGPWPWEYGHLHQWAHDFDQWARHQSTYVRGVALYLLESFNAAAPWSSGAFDPVRGPRLARGLDDTNRRGLAALVLNAAGF